MSTLLNNHMQISFGALISIFIISLFGYFSGHSMLEKTIEAGHNYLYELMIPFDNNLKLIFRYFSNFDGLLGIIIIILAMLSIATIFITSVKDREINQFLIIALVIFITILFDEIYGRYTGQKMLYARMIKQYNPLFLILIGFFYIKYLNSWKLYILPCVFVLVIFGYLKFYREFKSLAYPRDVLSSCVNSGSSGFEHDILSYDNNYQLIQKNEYGTRVHFTVPPQSKNVKMIPDSALFLNFSFPSQVSEKKWNEEFDHANFRTIYSQKHYISYIPYSFDCTDFESHMERRNKLKLEILVFDKNN